MLSGLCQPAPPTFCELSLSQAARDWPRGHGCGARTASACSRGCSSTSADTLTAVKHVCGLLISGEGAVSPTDAPGCRPPPPVPSLPDSPGWKGTPSVKVVCTSCPHSWHNKPCARHCPLHLAPLAPRHWQKFSSTLTTQMCARAHVNASLPHFRFGAWPSLSGHRTPRPGAPESKRPTRIQSPLQPLP